MEHYPHIDSKPILIAGVLMLMLYVDLTASNILMPLPLIGLLLAIMQKRRDG